MNSGEKIGLALIFDEVVTSGIVELQRKVSDQLKLEPQLSTTHNLPHVTLMQGL